MKVNTILDKLEQYVNPKILMYEFDVRYLQRRIRDYPQVFPKFVLENRYKLITIDKGLFWEHKLIEI